MTTMNHSEVIPMSTALQSRAEPTVSDRMVKFLAEELIPMMAGLWPKSTNQLNANLHGSAMAYGLLLKGFTANEIREVVFGIASREPDRDFAPAPQELRKLCIGKVQPSEKPRFIASMSSLEIQVCSKCLTGELDKTQQAVDAELSRLIAAVTARGGVVDGSRGFAPLKTIIQNG